MNTISFYSRALLVATLPIKSIQPCSLFDGGIKLTEGNSKEDYFYLERIIPGFLISFALAFLLELTGLYLLMILAGVVAGVFVKRGWLSFLIGFASVTLAWGIYFIVFALTTPLAAFLDLIGSMTGIPGSILLILALLLGGLMGGSGALVGAYANQLVLVTLTDSIKKKKNEEKTK